MPYIMMEYTCPEGYDCANLNSCPSPVAQCPPGMLCDDIENVDYLEAILETKPYVIDDFLITECPPGYYCPSFNAIEPCPAGSWCSFATAVPHDCETLGVCSTKAEFELNLMNLLLAFACTALVVLASFILLRRQRLLSLKSRNYTTPEARNSPSRDQVIISAPAEPQASGFNIAFTNLSVYANGKQLLGEVNGTIPGGKVTAIMGPSGAGKTTLMMELMGRNQGTRAQGKVFCNGRIMRPSDRQHIGFVPQEEIVDRRASARENIHYSGLCRIADASRQEIQNRVQAVIEALHLEPVADVIVGGDTNRAANISGGQLKRVNIGLELVSGSQCLFLDEPTSGLDSTSSLSLVTNLKTLADKGVTICMVIHQPRFEIFSLIDHLVLLEPGGKLAYEGPANQAVPYFESLPNLDLRLPFRRNPSDWLLDLVSHSPKFEERGGSAQIRHVTHARLSEIWASRNQAVPKLSTPASDARQPIERYRKPLCRQLMANMRREFTEVMRNKAYLAVFSFLHVFSAVSLSSGFTVLIHKSYKAVFRFPIPPEWKTYCPPHLQDLCDYAESSLSLQQMMFFLGVALGSAASLAAVPVFGKIKPLLRREMSSGIHPVAIGAGKMMSHALAIFWFALVFVGVWCVFGHAGKWYSWLALVFFTSFVFSGMGYLLSLLSKPGNAAVASMILVVSFSVFNGVVPPLKEVIGLPVVQLVWLLSPSLWASEALYVTFTDSITENFDMKAAGEEFGYEMDRLWLDYLMLAALGIAFRLLALLALWRLSAPSCFSTCKRKSKAEEATIVSV